MISEEKTMEMMEQIQNNFNLFNEFKFKTICPYCGHCDVVEFDVGVGEDDYNGGATILKLELYKKIHCNKCHGYINICAWIDYKHDDEYIVTIKPLTAANENDIKFFINFTNSRSRYELYINIPTMNISKMIIIEDYNNIKINDKIDIEYFKNILKEQVAEYIKTVQNSLGI